MKKFYFILAFIFLTGLVKAQETQPPATEKKQQDIEALKVAFISKELDLTPEEAEKFWPVYNQYSKELKTAVKDNTDVLDRDEKVLNIRKKYKERFTKILGQQRMNRLFSAEGKFHKVLIKAMRKNNKGHDKVRPILKRKNKAAFL